jgi:hypothetical protein
MSISLLITYLDIGKHIMVDYICSKYLDSKTPLQLQSS